MTDITEIKNAIKYCCEAFDKVGEFMGGSNSSGNRYYLNQAYGFLEAMENHLPVKKGSNVKLKIIPDCNNAWRSCKHFLIKGAPATVESIGSHDGYIYIYLIFDNESWIDSEGKVNPMQEKHTFKFYLDAIEVVER